MDVPRAPRKKRFRWLALGGGLAGVILTTVAVSRLEPAAPSVERGTVWTDTVRRGEMVRQVRGPGTLVAEDVRWVPAVTPGRVEIKRVLPGTPVEAGTVLLEMSNPDVEREELEARRQLAAAQSELATLQSRLEAERLAQEGVVATMRSQFREAGRQVQAQEALSREGMTSAFELAKARDVAEELRVRLSVEERKLGHVTQSMRTQIAAQEAQASILRTLAQFQRRQVESMQVRAPSGGVLQEMAVEPGQWVNSGTTLAKVVQPGRLKAVLRVPETQAKDVAVGQHVSIDTRNGIIPGRVVRIAPAAENGTVSVDVALEGALPQGARPDLSVDGTIDIERLPDVLYVGRPAYAQPESSASLFRLEPGGAEAVRVSVRLGRGSASTVEVLGGLSPGDVVVLSDMSQHEGAERVRLR